MIKKWLYGLGATTLCYTSLINYNSYFREFHIKSLKDLHLKNPESNIYEKILFFFLDKNLIVREDNNLFLKLNAKDEYLKFNCYKNAGFHNFIISMDDLNNYNKKYIINKVDFYKNYGNVINLMITNNPNCKLYFEIKEFKLFNWDEKFQSSPLISKLIKKIIRSNYNDINGIIVDKNLIKSIKNTIDFENKVKIGHLTTILLENDNENNKEILSKLIYKQNYLKNNYFYKNIEVLSSSDIKDKIINKDDIFKYI